MQGKLSFGAWQWAPHMQARNCCTIMYYILRTVHSTEYSLSTYTDGSVAVASHREYFNHLRYGYRLLISEDTGCIDRRFRPDAADD